MSQDRVNAANLLQEAVQDERWFQSIGDDGTNLILYVSSPSKARKRFDKRPLQWKGIPLLIKKFGRPRPLRGGIGNRKFYKGYP